MSGESCYKRIVFCVHYRGTAALEPCRLGMFPVSGDSQEVQRGRAVAAGCILAYRPNVEKIPVTGVCKKMEYPKSLRSRLIKLYNLTKGANVQKPEKVPA